MRLIGGNISDTPVKEIGDGSAFNVGGGTGAPDLVVVGTVPATGTAQSNFDESVEQLREDGNPGCGKYTAKWSDNSYGCFWLSNTAPYKLYYSHITTNSDGSFAAIATKVDLSGDLTVASNGTHTSQAAAIAGVKLSASRVVLHLSFPGADGALGQEDLVYDKDGDTVAEHGTVFDHGTPTRSDYTATSNLVAAVNADQGIVFHMDPSGAYTKISATPVHFTGTKTAGTMRDVTDRSTNDQGGVAFSDNSSPAKVFTTRQGSSDGTSALKEWSFTPGTTPELAGSYAADYSGWTYPSGAKFGSVETQSDGSFDCGGGMGVSLINRNDIERGRFISTLYGVSGAPEIGFFGGVSTNKSIVYNVAYMSVAGTHLGTDSNINSKILEIDYNDETYWGRYLHVGVLSGGAIFITPFNYNWNTFQMIRSAVGDLPNKAASATLANGAHLYDVLLGSSSADNICIIYAEATDDIRYLDVPITK